MRDLSNLDEMVSSTTRLQRANDALEKTLAHAQIGGNRIAAVAPRGHAPVLRSNGRDVVRFYPGQSQHEAERAALRTFGRLVGRELIATRTPAELKQTIQLFTRDLSEALSEPGSR